MVLKGGDATSGNLITMFDGARPNCTIAGTCHRHGDHTSQPMSKKGAIILGTGGDNSNGAMGKFYEGIMVTGVTTDATDEAVQANIVAVGYKAVPTPDVLSGYTNLGGDCPGNNIEKYVKDTANDCALQCEWESSCVGFSFSASRKVCWTKSATCAEPTTDTNFEFYRRDSGGSLVI